MSAGLGANASDSFSMCIYYICMYVCVYLRLTLDITPLPPHLTPAIKLNRPWCSAGCVSLCTHVHAEKGHVCCIVVSAVTNLLGPPDGSKSKVTELRLDKHRSPASISYPVHFGNTWLFLGAQGAEKEGVKRHRRDYSDWCV